MTCCPWFIQAMPKNLAPEIRPRLRISCGKNIALGPGKVELLELLHETGSITLAAKRMGMSYMRAWTLIHTMNLTFKEPVVVAARGGSKGGGGAELTPTGVEALALYSKMNAKSLKAIQPEWKRLKKLMRD